MRELCLKHLLLDLRDDAMTLVVDLAITTEAMGMGSLRRRSVLNLNFDRVMWTRQSVGERSGIYHRFSRVQWYPLLSPDSRSSCYDSGSDKDTIDDPNCLYSPWGVNVVRQHIVVVGEIGLRSVVEVEGALSGWRCPELMVLLIWGEE